VKLNLFMKDFLVLLLGALPAPSSMFENSLKVKLLPDWPLGVVFFGVVATTSS
jgi:hypothetical protein